MNLQQNNNAMVPPPSIKVYWILDGDEKAYFKRDIIKLVNGYFVREHSAWCIDNPSPDVIDHLKKHGLVTQFRRFQECRK